MLMSELAAAKDEEDTVPGRRFTRYHADTGEVVVSTARPKAGASGMPKPIGASEGQVDLLMPKESLDESEAGRGLR